MITLAVMERGSILVGVLQVPWGGGSGEDVLYRPFFCLSVCLSARFPACLCVCLLVFIDFGSASCIYPLALEGLVQILSAGG